MLARLYAAPSTAACASICDVLQSVIERERRGDYLGKTVQVVPHITDAIQDWIERVAKLPVDGRSGKPDTGRLLTAQRAEASGREEMSCCFGRLTEADARALCSGCQVQQNMHGQLQTATRPELHQR